VTNLRAVAKGGTLLRTQVVEQRPVTFRGVTAFRCGLVAGILCAPYDPKHRARWIFGRPRDIAHNDYRPTADALGRILNGKSQIANGKWKKAGKCAISHLSFRIRPAVFSGL
jgi:hypothetical protein